MPRARCKFRQDDVTRAIKAARAAGLEAWRVEILNDRIIVMPGAESKAELDRELEDFESRHGQN
jgi:hypothetical protein